MTVMSRAQITALIETIRTETVIHGNTPDRVGTCLKNMADSAVFLGEAQTPPTAGNGLTGTNTFSILPNGTTLDVSASGVKIADIAANAIIGRAGGTSGAVAAIAAATDGHALRLSGATLGFGTLATAAYTDASVTMGKLADLAGLSVIGRAANSSGVPAAITASATGQVLLHNGTTIGFGAPNFGSQSLTTTGPIIQATSKPAQTGNIRWGGAATFGINGRNSADSADYSLLAYDPTVPGVAIGSNGIALVTVTGTAIRLQGTTVELGTTGSTQTKIYSPQLQWDNSVVAPQFGQTNIGTATATGQPVIFFSQDVAGNTSTTGGTALFRAGDATGAGGTHVGGATTIRGGDATGASGTRTGGNLIGRPGSGATAGGFLDLQNSAGTSRIKINGTGIGAFGVTPVAQSSDMVAITDNSTGTPSTAVADVGGAFNQAGLNNIHATFAAQINKLRTAMRAMGYMA